MKQGSEERTPVVTGGTSTCGHGHEPTPPTPRARGTNSVPLHLPRPRAVPLLRTALPAHADFNDCRAPPP